MKGARWLFGFFFVSGFCGLLYQVVWLRLAMAEYGVTTALASLVLSVFMGGLAAGSVAAGAFMHRLSGQSARVLLWIYAVLEVVASLSSVAVPQMLSWGRGVLASWAGGATWGSGAYYLGSGLLVTLALLPFCTAFGATVPVGMAIVRRLAPAGSPRSFSYLYLANLLGAATGTVLTGGALIEIFGFRGTLSVAAAGNSSIAVAALLLSLRPDAVAGAHLVASAPPALAGAGRPVAASLLAALFATGLASMGMEVVWIRQFTPYLGNVVYTFSSILALYLLSTALGSAVYRRRARGGSVDLPPGMWAWVAVASLLPLAAADPRLRMTGVFGAGFLRLVLGLPPFCALLGFATPLLMDRWSEGEPRRAGRAYALNVLGCILGPLVAGFGLLPWLGERSSLVSLAGLVLVIAVLPPVASDARPRGGALPLMAALAVGAVLVVGTRSFESLLQAAVIRRDASATVVAAGSGMQKRLLVNGVGMTYLTPIAKLMTHLPLVFQEQPPRSALVICLGMGTSYRSAMSWSVDTTVVELVPSVASLVGYFQADVAGSERNRILIDDGRRFLERTSRSFDAIVIDPPPPLEAAGSSLLYSREFYSAADRRLSDRGILQQWIPDGDPWVVASAVKSVLVSFPHVRSFQSVEGWGLHLLASRRPIPDLAAEVLASRLSPTAARDLVEWGPEGEPSAQLALVLGREVPRERLEAMTRGVPPLTDDRPVNEYFLLRSFRAGRPPFNRGR